MLKAILTFALTRRAIVLMALIVFGCAGLFAFAKLNIEAYPNPAPVILEITAQAAGLSAEEMEKYYTIPMEIGLYPTAGIDTIRSTSFYGLSFVRVTFKYGVDYYAAYTQAALMLQQNVTLPGNQVPQIQQSSLVGEVYRYQVVGPPNFGLTNLRTVQDWIVLRRLSTIPGVVQINSWGGTTKEFEVEADLHKLEAYNVTVPQLITALGNANVNVGGREISIGQQSINIRGVGLIDSGGGDDLTKGTKVEDIENVVLSQTNGVPVIVKQVARVYIGYVPRLGIAGRDHDDDVAASIVVMGRTQHTNDIVPRIKTEVAKLNSDGTLPPGVKIVPYYDRTTLVSVTTHTVLHNLIFGCLLVFLIQWIFLGDLRSAIIVSVNIPFALLFAIIMLVLQNQDANLLSIGAVDFGIIIDSAVILVENVFRNLQLPQAQRAQILEDLHEEGYGPDPTRRRGSRWTNRLRMIYVSGLQVDNAILFSSAITIAAFVSAVHDDRRRRADLRSDGAHLRLRARRRLARYFHRDPGIGVVSAAGQRQRGRDDRRADSAQDLSAGARILAASAQSRRRARARVSGCGRLSGPVPRQRIPAGLGRGQLLDPCGDAANDVARCGCRSDAQDARDPAQASADHYGRLAARAAR